MYYRLKTVGKEDFYEYDNYIDRLPQSQETR